MESVMLGDPVIIIMFIIAFALNIFAQIKKARAVTVISAVIFTLAVAYSLLKGADLFECGAVAALFFIVSFIPLWKKGGDK